MALTVGGVYILPTLASQEQALRGLKQNCTIGNKQLADFKLHYLHYTNILLDTVFIGVT